MQFLKEDFLLQSDTAKQLYHDYAAKQSIIDFHNHLSAKELYENKNYSNLTQVWLSGDHYKWRAMRACGIEETYITGTADDFQKFQAWCKTVPDAIGNPLYHWTHLELKRYFQMEEPLTSETCESVWKQTKEWLQTPEYTPRNLLRMQNVKVLCTTDDPMDSLEYHRKLKEESFEIQVLPTFRPDQVMGIEKDSFPEYIKEIQERMGQQANHLEELLELLQKRLDYFVECGCRVSDHSLEGDFYQEASLEEADKIYQKRLQGNEVTPEEASRYRGFLMLFLGKEYAKRDLVMQLHIGAIRNVSSRVFQNLGANVGNDSMDDRCYAPKLAALLDGMDKSGELPKTILYSLNAKDLDMLASMAGNFQGGGTRGKMQLGPAWWLNDHQSGIRAQLESMASQGLLSTAIGMLTDSRSLLSFPRHEYYRRILCDVIGTWVERGEYPKDMQYLGNMVQNICGQNAMQYFRLERDE